MEEPSDKTVINFSDWQLNNIEKAVLVKKEKFGVTLRKISVKDIITNVEAVVRELPLAQTDKIRNEAVKALRRLGMLRPFMVCQKNNFSLVELQALRELKVDGSFVILPADKGSETVVMNTRDYQRKVEKLLDSQTYRKLRKDCTAVVLRRTVFLVKQIFPGACYEDCCQRHFPRDFTAYLRYIKPVFHCIPLSVHRFANLQHSWGD